MAMRQLTQQARARAGKGACVGGGAKGTRKWTLPSPGRAGDGGRGPTWISETASSSRLLDSREHGTSVILEEGDVLGFRVVRELAFTDSRCDGAGMARLAGWRDEPRLGESWSEPRWWAERRSRVQ
jgi:hypothetical protein